MTTPQEGNRIILLSLALALAAAALFAQWGVIPVNMDDLRNNLRIDGQTVGDSAMEAGMEGFISAMLEGTRIPVNGLGITISLGPLRLPNWLPIAAVLAALIFTFTNSRQLSAVPRPLMRALFLTGIIAGTTAAIIFLMKGSLGIGGLLLIAAASIGLYLQRDLIPDAN